MKKKMIVGLIAIIVVVGIYFAWHVGYSTRKSNDNLPALSSIAEMSESEVNNILPGYQIAQLREVWGAPDTTADGTDSWKAGNMTLVFNYKNNGIVSICGLKDENGISVGEE